MAHYPVFLKNEPLIWGITLSDLMKLSSAMFLMSLLGIGELYILILVGVFYGSLIAVRKMFPRRHFEFLFKRKDQIPLFHLIRKSKKKEVKNEF